ncbi:MAG: transcription antitermination factor NusB [Proteobacteria bacterium]|nr:transcription antitermination factor NusB [Pseudomonadota bacterium]
MKTGHRRLSREIALQCLFQHAPGGGLSPKDSFALFTSSFAPGGEEEASLECERDAFDAALPFAWELFSGVAEHFEELSRLLEQASENWRLDRMSRVDRSIMLMALFEMKFREDIPPKVSLNEAIDLGKQYGTEDSGAFINGVLDRIHRYMIAADRKPGDSDTEPAE